MFLLSLVMRMSLFLPLIVGARIVEIGLEAQGFLFKVAYTLKHVTGHAARGLTALTGPWKIRVEGIPARLGASIDHGLSPRQLLLFVRIGGHLAQVLGIALGILAVQFQIGLSICTSRPAKRG